MLAPKKIPDSLLHQALLDASPRQFDKMYSSIFLVLLASLFARVHGKITIINPGPQPDQFTYDQNPQYKVGQTVPVKWESNYSRFDLYLLLAYPTELSLQLLSNTTSTDWAWTVSLDNYTDKIPAGEEYVFWFNLDAYTDDDATVDSTNSAFFNVSAPAKEHKTSTGTIVGIAVGSTLAIELVLGIIIFFTWKHFRSLKGFREWKKTQGSSGQNTHYQQTEFQPSDPSWSHDFYNTGDPAGRSSFLSPPHRSGSADTDMQRQSQSPREMYVEPSTNRPGGGH